LRIAFLFAQRERLLGGSMWVENRNERQDAKVPRKEREEVIQSRIRTDDTDQMHAVLDLCHPCKSVANVVFSLLQTWRFGALAFTFSSVHPAHRHVPGYSTAHRCAPQTVFDKTKPLRLTNHGHVESSCPANACDLPRILSPVQSPMAAIFSRG
jgi:hypothetical protein